MKYYFLLFLLLLQLPAFSQNTPGKYPQTSQRLITSADLQGKMSAELKIMRNEIYARHGFIFKTTDMKEYFSSQPWYHPQYSDVTADLSAIEKQNAVIIKNRETQVAKIENEDIVADMPTYNFKGHADFRIFWTDFKKAVNAGDKKAVAQMTRFPFKDSRNGGGNGPDNLTCKTPDELISKYNRIFIPAVVTAINGNKYDQCINYDGDPDNDHQEKIPNCYELLTSESAIWLDFSKTNVYKLDAIPYKE